MFHVYLTVTGTPPKKSLSCFHLIENFAAKILTLAKKTSHFNDPGFLSPALFFFITDFKV